MRLWFLILLILSIATHAQTPQKAEAQPATTSVQLDIITEKLNRPWGLAALPNGDFLVTERSGKLLRIQPNGTQSQITGIPEVYNKGQGGLLDITLDPDFSNNQRLYFTFAEADAEGLSGTAVARAKLNKETLTELKVIFRQMPKVNASNHFGSRLAFAKDGTLFIGLGERFHFSEKAQTLDNHFGKVIRIHTDGSTPKDNPFINTPGALPEIWSYGHRNIQGAATHPITQEIWMHEHGPKGGDEINRPKAGNNYGWPKASYGSHYTMVPIEDNHQQQGFVEPLFYWTPSIAPSGMTFVAPHPSVKEWQGNLFIGALAGRHLVRLIIEDDKIVRYERLLENQGWRIRAITQGVDGALYVVTDESNGKLVRLTPKR